MLPFNDSFFYKGHVIANISMTGSEDEMELSVVRDPVVTFESSTADGARVVFEPRFHDTKKILIDT